MPRTKKGEYTVKELKFIKNVVSGNSLADSAEKAYKVKSRGNAWSMGKEMVKKPRIKQAIQLALDKAGLNPETVADFLKESIVLGIQSGKATVSDSLRGIDIYSKLTGLYDSQTLEQSYKITLHKLPNKSVVGELEKTSKTSSKLLQDIRDQE